MKVLIIGAHGALGNDLVEAFRAAGHETEGCDRATLDITDRDAVRAKILNGGFYGLIVNAAAWNDVDGAEDPANRARVFAVNAEAPGYLAEAARDAGVGFVHFSTDYVFEGTKPEGYREDDEPHPISVYGESKLAGERAVVAVGGRWFVCRTSKLFGGTARSTNAKPSFMSIMLRLAAERASLDIVDEEVGMPTSTADLAEATVRLVKARMYPYGIYHLVNDGPGVTWYGFAEEFFRIAGVVTPRKPVPSSAFPKKAARRPKHAALLNTKFPLLRPRIEALRQHLAARVEPAEQNV